MPEIMLYKRGTTIKCGPFSLDYIIVSEEEIEDKLTLGWVKNPAETESPEPEPEPAQRKKPGPKPKVAQDGANKG
ncbi:hypothetical protein AO825_08250 [Pectobacterium brasiliense]|uniref:hypothetical protein n=1 Tax=Pectobacterium brasiliense TaxID=180957 RepID=UPI0001A42733|nr:hypothetical protein [Pectobacterium brasiliense]KRF62841.1 hypothetical protein AO825_08250 [Pectobacterium brasiliense]MBN3186050.1 hypothetical protein [Pectobacterium brasiliense]QHG26882.1 hypothetical protein GT391_01790 [Pectobacterium brasiliense]